jgi:hypothetical protein
MTWGTDFATNIFLSRQSYPRKHDVEIRIEELNELISECEAQLKMYASATPKDIISPDDSEDPINWLSNRIDEELSMYREYVIDRYNLDLYLEYLGENEEIKNEQNGI